MYSYEERKQAVEWYHKLGSIKAVQHLLEYPSKNTLKAWVKEFEETDDLHRRASRHPKYTADEKKAALDYYVTHGKNVSKTIRDLGYPCRTIFKEWIKEAFPDDIKCGSSRKTGVYLSKTEKKNAVIELCAKEHTVKKISRKYNVDRVTLYNWKHKMFGDKDVLPMDRSKKPDRKSKCDINKTLAESYDELQQKYDALQKETYKMQLEYDALKAASEIIKKDQGITMKILTNKEKAIVIDTLRNKYPLKELLSVFQMAKSSYFYQEKLLTSSDKYEAVREEIRKIFTRSMGTYGYRRIYLVLRNNNSTISEKVVRRIMKEESLAVKFIKKKKYSSYMGEITPSVPNILKRDFHADTPNSKWLTDITEFHIPAGKVYLSPIIDCFDGLPVSWTIGTRPNAELVNTMLDAAIATLREDEKPIVHSDRGAHYRWPEWINKINKAGLTRSMSKKGFSPDNSACEGFFGRLKNEMFYGRSWKNISIDEFIIILDEYIQWYARERIKVSLGGLSPIDYRKSLGMQVA